MDDKTESLLSGEARRDSGVFDMSMDTSTPGGSISSASPSSSTGTVTPPIEELDETVDEVDTVTVSVRAVNEGIEATVSVDGMGQDFASDTRTVGLVNSYPGRSICSTPGSITAATYMEKDAPTPSIPIEIQVFVKTLRGNTVTCNLTAESLVSELEQETFRKSGVPAEQQRLTFDGKTLSCPTKRLVDYGIKNESTVYMMGRLRGGGDNYFNSNNHYNCNGRLVSIIKNNIRIGLSDYYNMPYNPTCFYLESRLD